MSTAKGFTLIELVIVIGIVGILAVIATPIYLNYLAKSQKTEAKTNLGAIYIGMLSYSAQLLLEGFGGATLGNIDFYADGMKRYTYSLVTVSTISFLARASGVSGQVSGDIWEIDETRSLNDLNPSFDN